MNIAIFSDCYLPSKNGVVTVITQLKESLEKKGHEVTIVTVKNQDKTKTTDSEYKAFSIPVGLGTTDQYIGFISFPKLLRYLKKKNIDLIHVHTEFTVGHAGKVAARRLKVPLITTSHTSWEDYYHYYLKGAKFIPVGIIRHLMRNYFSHSTAVIAVSKKTQNYLLQDYMIPKLPVFVINNALDPSKFSKAEISIEEKNAFRQNWNVKDDEVLALFVGRVGEEKRIFELLQIAKKSIAENPKLKLMVVGDGPALASCKEFVKENNLSENVIFTGFMAWETLHTVYSSADIFVTASLSEMHPVTISEAIISKMPIIARHDESLTDRVIHDENGYLAENDEEFANYLTSLSKDAAKRVEFGKNSAIQIKKCYPDVFVAKHLALYEEAIKAYPKQINRDSVKAAFDKIEEEN